MGLNRVISSMAFIAMLLTSGYSVAEQPKGEECVQQDFEHNVSASGHCLLLNTYKSPSLSENPTLIVFVHGDGLRTRGERSIKGLLTMLPESKETNTVLVALTRPGYQNNRGKSTGNHHYYEGDAYREYIIKAVSNAILSLKEYYKAKKLVVIGHSGGANILALSMGTNVSFKPDTAILISGSYYVEKWSKHRGLMQWYKGRGLSPHENVDGITATIKITAVTGENDTNTLPEFGSNYIKQLQLAGKNATFIPIKGSGHNDILRNADMWKLVKSDIF